MDQQADGQTDSQTDKQTDKQTEQTIGQRRMMDRQAKKMIRWADGQTERKTEQPDILWMDRQRNRQPKEQTSAETDG